MPAAARGAHREPPRRPLPRAAFLNGGSEGVQAAPSCAAFLNGGSEGGGVGGRGAPGNAARGAVRPGCAALTADIAVNAAPAAISWRRAALTRGERRSESEIAGATGVHGLFRRQRRSLAESAARPALTGAPRPPTATPSMPPFKNAAHEGAAWTPSLPPFKNAARGRGRRGGSRWAPRAAAGIRAR